MYNLTPVYLQPYSGIYATSFLYIYNLTQPYSAIYTLIQPYSGIYLHTTLLRYLFTYNLTLVFIQTYRNLDKAVLM